MNFGSLKKEALRGLLFLLVFVSAGHHYRLRYPSGWAVNQSNPDGVIFTSPDDPNLQFAVEAQNGPCPPSEAPLPNRRGGRDTVRMTAFLIETLEEGGRCFRLTQTWPQIGPKAQSAPPKVLAKIRASFRFDKR